MFRNPVDIANRGLQLLGATRISDTLGFTEDSKNASAMAFVYDKLRRVELRKAHWKFSTRKTALRAISSTSVVIQPTLWSSGTTYWPGSIAADTANTWWISNSQDNLNNAPGNSFAWDLYTGPVALQPYDSGIAYFSGELVYTYTGDGTYKIYLSLVSSNSDNPATATTYDATATYFKDQVVTYLGVPYQSLIDLNLANTPLLSPTKWNATVTRPQGSAQWLQITPTIAPLYVPYPVGAGPVEQAATRNAYRLPSGFVREAPQDPKAGSVSIFGAPTGRMYDDWLYEGDFIITRNSDLMVYRFIADIQDVTKMDDLFCEALAAQMGFAACEEITQSVEKQKVCIAAYNDVMSKARMINSVETGAVEPAEDDWVSTRL